MSFLEIVSNNSSVDCFRAIGVRSNVNTLLQRLAECEEEEVAIRMQIKLDFDDIRTEITTATARLVQLIKATKKQSVERLSSQLAKRQVLVHLTH